MLNPRLVEAAVVVLLLLHLCQLVLYPSVMNLRSSIAVAVFLLAAVFAPARSDSDTGSLLLQLFGLAGAAAIMVVLHVNAVPG